MGSLLLGMGSLLLRMGSLLLGMYSLTLGMYSLTLGMCSLTNGEESHKADTVVRALQKSVVLPFMFGFLHKLVGLRQIFNSCTTSRFTPYTLKQGILFHHPKRRSSHGDGIPYRIPRPNHKKCFQFHNRKNAPMSEIITPATILLFNDSRRIRTPKITVNTVVS